MNRALPAIALLAAATIAAITAAWAPQPARDNKPASDTTPKFLAFDIVIDTGSEPLAAYQLEFKDALGHSRIVGVEGGQPGPYNAAPHYDPKAIQGEHLIIAAFTTDAAPTGKVRVARIHLMAEGGTPEFTTRLTTSAPGARTFEATLTIQPLTQPTGDGK